MGKEIENKQPTILFENEDVVVINKPSNMIVHKDGRRDEYTVADWLLEKYPAIENVGESWESPQGEIIPRPGIVHRLDRDTTGVMIIAKTDEAFAFLKEQFKERGVQKTYYAFVYDAIKESEGVIDKQIGKSRSDFRRWSAQPGAKGVLRDAQTHWWKIGEVEKDGAVYTYVKMQPKTGRTHQLRVHMKAIHHPIVCDSLYAPKRECALEFGRIALHAHELAVTLPNQKEMTFTAPFPNDFEYAMSCLK